MVVFLDLDSDDDLVFDPRSDAHSASRFPLSKPRLGNAVTLKHVVREADKRETEGEERPNPNLNGFSAALACYP